MHIVQSNLLGSDARPARAGGEEGRGALRISTVLDKIDGQAEVFYPLFELEGFVFHDPILDLRFEKLHILGRASLGSGIYCLILTMIEWKTHEDFSSSRRFRACLKLTGLRLPVNPSEIRLDWIPEAGVQDHWLTTDSSGRIYTTHSGAREYGPKMVSCLDYLSILSLLVHKEK